MLKEIQKWFAQKGLEPREPQIFAINNIIKAIESGKKNIILDAKVGIGKSLIAGFVAEYYEARYNPDREGINNAFILTPTKYLQEQYLSDFPEYPTIKGRSNFNCRKHYEEVMASDFQNQPIDTCADSWCVYHKRDSHEFPCEYSYTEMVYKNAPESERDNPQDYYYIKNENTPCEYIKQKFIGMKAPITILNYDYALAEFTFVKQMDDRFLAVYDEAHNFEPKVINFCKVELNRDESALIEEGIPNKDYLTELLVRQDYEDEYINNYIENLKVDKNVFKASEVKESISIMYDKLIKANSDNEKALSKYEKKRDNIISKMDMVIENPDEWIWYFDEIKYGKTEYKKLIFAPITAMDYADLLLHKTQINIFMTGTPFNRELFCKWLSLNEDETEFIHIPDSFPPENHEIYLTHTGRFSGNGKKTNQSIMYKAIEGIIGKHYDEKGVIHCPSYKLAKDIFDNVGSDRLMMYAKGNTKDKERKLKEYKESDNKVLIGFSLEEGVDFKDDEGRFQIVTKVQNLYPTNEISARNDLDNWQWYHCQAVKSLQQTLGRIIRSADDYGVTYILDSNINTVFDRAFKHNINIDYILESLIFPEINYQLTDKPSNRIREAKRKSIIDDVKTGHNNVKSIINDTCDENDSIKTYINTAFDVQKTLGELVKSGHLEVV